MGLLVFTHYRIHPQGDALQLNCVGCGQPTMHQHQKVNKWTLICLMLPLKSWSRDVLLCPSCNAGTRVAATLLPVIAGASESTAQVRVGTIAPEDYATRIAEPTRLLTEALVSASASARRGVVAAAAQPAAAGAMLAVPPPAPMQAVAPAPPPVHSVPAAQPPPGGSSF